MVLDICISKDPKIPGLAHLNPVYMTGVNSDAKAIRSELVSSDLGPLRGCRVLRIVPSTMLVGSFSNKPQCSAKLAFLISALRRCNRKPSCVCVCVSNLQCVQRLSALRSYGRFRRWGLVGWPRLLEMCP